VSPQAVIAASPVVVPPLPQQQPVAKPVVTTSPVNVNINFPAK
jgi:hypothetical protein